MPLKAAGAKKLIRRLLAEGLFVIGSHARDEMAKDELSAVDAANVLRGGIVGEAEWENGAWRYQVRTQRMVFVVEFDPEPEKLPGASEDIQDLELVVITAWRLRR